jgi:hypothetical protein
MLFEVSVREGYEVDAVTYRSVVARCPSIATSPSRSDTTGAETYSG